MTVCPQSNKKIKKTKIIEKWDLQTPGEKGPELLKSSLSDFVSEGPGHTDPVWISTVSGGSGGNNRMWGVSLSACSCKDSPAINMAWRDKPQAAKTLLMTALFWTQRGFFFYWTEDVKSSAILRCDNNTYIVIHLLSSNTESLTLANTISRCSLNKYEGMFNCTKQQIDTHYIPLPWPRLIVLYSKYLVSHSLYLTQTIFCL